MEMESQPGQVTQPPPKAKLYQKDQLREKLIRQLWKTNAILKEVHNCYFTESMPLGVQNLNKFAERVNQQKLLTLSCRVTKVKYLQINKNQGRVLSITGYYEVSSDYFEMHNIARPLDERKQIQILSNEKKVQVLKEFLTEHEQSQYPFIFTKLRPKILMGNAA